jgi:gamma-glutamyltranspeptidase/glutathione hydrolase
MQTTRWKEAHDELSVKNGLVLNGSEPPFTVGSSGGRKIMGTSAQIIANIVDHGLGIEAAINAPKIDCSTADLLLDNRLPPTVIEQLRKMGHRTAVVQDAPAPRRFASAAGILRDPQDNLLHSGLDPFYPAAAAGHQ